MSRKVFINLPVTDLKRAKEFYTRIGFSNNPAFTDDTAACMVFTEEIFVMLLTHEKLKQFTKKEIIDTKKFIGAINCLSLESVDEMNAMADAAIHSGVVETDEPKDFGFMQQRSFEDPDGNHWEVMYMDLNKFPASN